MVADTTGGEVSQTWADLWAVCTDILGSSEEARFIIEQASGHSGAAWLVATDAHASPSAAQVVQQMCERRRNGEPLQYVLGRWGFRYLNLYVDKRALIPRPETEVLVDVGLRLLTKAQAPQLVADLGTGTGAIALSIATELATSHVFATDNSRDALELARKNLDEVQRSKSASVEFHEGSWFEALPSDLLGELDLIVSNPPYVPLVDKPSMSPQVLDWEPTSALFAGQQGLDDLEHIVNGSMDWLAPGGALLVEMDPTHAKLLPELAEARGYSAAVVGQDLTGRDRWMLAIKASGSGKAAQ